MKVRSLNEPPRSFSSKPVMKNTVGVMKPSQTAPINPSPTNIQSTPSACIKIDLMLRQLFIIPLLSTVSEKIPKRRLNPKETTHSLSVTGRVSRVMFHVFSVVFILAFVMKEH